MKSVPLLQAKYYPTEYKEVADSTSLLQRETQKRVKPGSRLLDIGAGSGRGYKHFYGAHLTGVDVSDEVLSNPHLDRAIRSDASRLPLPNDEFDTVISDYTFEHLDDPVSVIREVYRVLQPGGYFLLRTVNRFHYVALVASLVPNKFHNKMAPWAQKERAPEDVFPTRYRLNTKRGFRRELTRAGFESVQIWMVEGEPSYLHFSRLLYLAGVFYERVLNGTRLLSSLRANLVIAARKPL